ncbi:MAG: recombinase family protein [Gammaproteobacteria bacterium]|nr:recombinase family protein [Gammaproteobacteria bacterium]
MSRRRKLDPTRAVAYVRVSTTEQEIGPEAQIHGIKRWCEQYGIELVCEPFVDHGMSGGLEFEKRPGLVDAYEALRTYNAGILVAHKRDRLARDVRVMSQFSMMLNKIGATVCTADKPPDAGKDLDPMTEALEGMQDVFAQLERSMIRARTKQALAVKRRRGERIGTIPYGFKLAADGKRLIRDAREQKVVAVVRRLRKKGESLRAIATELARLGLKPRTGKAWYPTTIKKIAEQEDAS